MGATSKIGWTNSTWNPIRGCTRVSPGCQKCYAEKLTARFSDPGQWGEGFAHFVTRPDGDREARWTGKMALIPDALELPLRWQRPRMIFVNSLSDLFHESLSDDDIDQVFAVMALAQQHTFQVLTKRSDRMRRYFDGFEEDGRFHEGARDALIEGAAQALYAKRHPGEDPSMWLAVHPPLANVWLGVSVEDQQRAEDRVLDLLETPAAVRFVSYEPALGPVDFSEIWIAGDPDQSLNALRGIRSMSDGTARHGAALDWIIVGGESGPGARPFYMATARSTVRQCQAAGVPVFVKQLGSNPIGVDRMPFHLAAPKGDDMDRWPQDLQVQEWPMRKADA